MTEMTRATLFCMDAEDEGHSQEFLWIEAWLGRWKDQVRIADYSSGGYEHLWDIEAPAEALGEVPEEYFCFSERSPPTPGPAKGKHAFFPPLSVALLLIGAGLFAALRFYSEP